MAKKRNSGLNSFIAVVLWITSILVFLAVGFGMIDSVLRVKFIPDIITVITGWIVVVLTVLGLILTIIEKSG